MTVVVPLFNDVELLTACIESLVEHVDTRIDNVILVNDCGPDATAVEAASLALIHDVPGFRYVRNDRNLGFVGTCNRAVTELDRTGNDVLLLNSDTVVAAGLVDELAGVLHLSEFHGLVCPRSNNATIATFPYRLAHPTVERKESRTLLLHKALSKELPRYSTAPVSMGFCLLVRRDLVDRFGLFDEAFSPGYGEENDLSLRLNAHGYRSLIANRALVLHAGATSFGNARATRLRSSHERKLRARYPFYPRAVAMYLQHDLDGVDLFADLLAQPEQAPSVLIDIDPRQTGSNDVRDLLDAAHSYVANANGVVVVRCLARVRRRLMRRYPLLTFRPLEFLDAVHDIAIVLGSHTSISQLVRLNRTALRWLVVFTSPPSASVWSTRVANPGITSALAYSARFADVSLHVHPSSPDELAAFLGEVNHTTATVVVSDAANAAAIIAGAAEYARAEVNLEALRARARHFSLVAGANRNGYLARMTAPTWAILQAERIAPRTLTLARNLRRRLRETDSV